MSIHIVRLGSPRARNEGPRLGTVRRPPRGVPKTEFAKRDYYDTWLPELSPSADLVKRALNSEDEREWQQFVKAYRAEMKKPEAARWLEVLATMSRSADFAVGCYCEDESHCHRSVLRELLREHGAEVAE